MAFTLFWITDHLQFQQALSPERQIITCPVLLAIQGFQGPTDTCLG